VRLEEVSDGQNTLPIKGVVLWERIMEKIISSPTKHIPEVSIPMIDKKNDIIATINTL